MRNSVQLTATFTRLRLTAFGLGALVLGACGGGGGTTVTTKAVLEGYASIAFAMYGDSVTKASALKTALSAFTTSPTATTLQTAKDAWNAAREPYLLTETMRFYDGPIDNATDGREGRINGWPMDESYIDYIEGNASTGIINDTVMYPTIDADVIAGADGAVSETTISAGFHAIEFLLWGQDRSATGPGARPHTDFVTGSGGTAANQARRAQYLNAAADLLVRDLTFVRDAWAPSALGNYRGQFVNTGAEGLRRILTGMGSLSGAELSRERMQVAYETKDQEDEHSCFSDTTHLDHRQAALGMQSVYLGRYATLQVASLADLVKAKNTGLDTAMKAALQASVDAIKAIPPPFDQAILGDDAAPGRVKVKASIDALVAQTTKTVEVATALGVALNF